MPVPLRARTAGRNRHCRSSNRSRAKRVKSNFGNQLLANAMRSITGRVFRLYPRLHTLVFAVLLSVTIVRPAAAVDFTDLWVSQSELGWGVNFDQADNFIFATFFIYGPDQQPTWYSGELTLGMNGVWSGPLYLSTGSYFGVPWNTAQKTIGQVGTVTFTPSSSYEGTLTYNVGSVNAAKVISRLTLTTIALGGTYAGAQISILNSCNDSSQNGSVRYFFDLVVTQSTTGALQLDFNTNSFSCRMAGAYIQDGQLYRMPNGAYTCGPSFSTSVQMSQIKQTAQGIEGQWVAPWGGGCVETGYFSAVLN
jgi:hypothetical protein